MSIIYKIQNNKLWNTEEAKYVTEVDSNSKLIELYYNKELASEEYLIKTLKNYNFDLGELESKEDKEKEEAITQSSFMIDAKAKAFILQTASFSSDEYQLLAKASMFEEWTVGHTYEAGYKIQFEGIVYEVKQKVTALEHQKPGSTGMEAIYSPLCTNPETGETPDGTQENPYSFIYSMSVKKGCFYKYEDHIYEALMDVETCVWYPNATGVETIWKLIK